MAIASGTTLGRYEIRSQLGAGGMGEVYLARDTSELERTVALKFLPAELASDQNRMQRFVQEARTVSALNHPNILTIYEFGQADAVRFIAMEYVDGVTLRDEMRERRLKLHDVLDIATQIAAALNAAHEANVVHRDIKPENIMVRRDHIVKVLDFGLAKLTMKSAATEREVVDSQAGTKVLVHTEPGLVMGTASYMSPEQARGLQVDTRTDIFSLSVVIYEMVAGCLPFAGSNTNEIMASILSDDESLPLARYSRDVPAEMERIVTKGLRKNRDERYQTIKDTLLDLKSLKQQLQFEVGLARSRPSELRGISPVVFDANIVETSRPEIKSVAVLPLENLSGDPTQDYFADGMTDELISDLGKVGVWVISRTSVMQYKGVRKPLREIGRELNAEHVVEGSVLRSGERVRITVKLIHAATDRLLWSDSYQRDLRDILELQSALAQDIAGEIRTKLKPENQGLRASALPVEPAALDNYLKGRDFFNQGRNKIGTRHGEEFLKKAVDYFELAVKIDSNYALAHAGLARAYHWVATNLVSPEFYPKAKCAAIRAIQLDAASAEAHAALAFTLLYFDRDWPGAERGYRRAIELNPSYADARSGYARYLSSVARHQQAISEIQLAVQLDPLTIAFKLNLGFFYLNARQYDRAIEQFQRVVAFEPDYPGVHGGIGRAYMFKRMYDEGLAELRTQINLWRGNPSKHPLLAWAYAVAGQRSDAMRVLNEGLKLPEREQALENVTIASAYAALGDEDQALAWLDKAYEEHSALPLQERSPDSLAVLKVNPSFDSLRSDPRFQDLIRRVGLPQ